MSKTILIILLFLSQLWDLKAQESLPKNSSWNDSATYYIRNLDALVVRLRTRSVAIEKLRAAGDEIGARRIEKIQREENEEIMDAFRDEFDFCKVYFMFSDSTNAMLSGKKSGYFLNDSLKVAPETWLTGNVFLIAEKGNAKQYVKPDPAQPNAEESERGYLNEAIVILDQRLRQLKDPFPYYAQEVFPHNVFGTSWNGKVKTLNSKFHRYRSMVGH